MWELLDSIISLFNHLVMDFVDGSMTRLARVMVVPRSCDIQNGTIAYLDERMDHLLLSPGVPNRKVIQKTRESSLQ
jgi:hypothetical protein